MTSTIRRRFPALSMALGLVLTFPIAAGPVVADEDVVCDRGWADVELRADIAPEGVLAFDPDKPWIAGGALLGGGRRAAAVLHGLGERAELEQPPLPDTRDSGLMAIASTGPGEPIWAVGFGRETDFVAAYVTRRDDGGWGRTETIRPDGFNAALTDVDASPQAGAWASGFLQGAPGDQRPWVVQLGEDGRTGHRLPLEDGERATLAGISVSDEGGVWVVGAALSDASMDPYIAVREGTGWDRFVIDGAPDAAIADIDVPTSDVGWAVGHRLEGGTIRPLIMRWGGVIWSEFEPPDLGAEPALLTSVSLVEGVLTVGGTRWDAEKGRYAPLVARYVDERWRVTDARRGWGMGTVTDISGDPGVDGWVVGRADEGIVARICDAEQRPASSPVLTSDSVSPPAPVTAEPEGPLPGRVVAVDVAGEAGLPTESQSWGATAADFDGDGDADVFLGRHGARGRLYRNDGGNYVDSELKFGGGDRHACAAADIDASGLPDLYCAFGASRGTGTKHNQLWLDPGGDTPRLHPTAGGATEPLGRGRQPRFFDIDEDGDLDLFIGQETKRMDGQPSTNRAFLAVGPADFEAAQVPGIDTGLAAEGIHIADYDGDGRDDMLLVYWDKRAVGPKAGIRLYRNEEGLAFTDVTTETGIGSIDERDALLADLDGDGELDLVQLSPDRVVVSLAQDGRFERTWDRGVSEGTALAAGDADGDGDTDLYVLQGKSDGGAHDIILRNAGDGSDFSTIDVPEVRGGSEDDVIALDYDSDGRADFLALNGRNSQRGPVQLITLEAKD